MQAAESNAPEGRGAQARASEAVASMGRGEAPGLRGGAKRQVGGSPPAPHPPVPSALPRWSCRHPVCGRVSRPRRAGGAYNTELAAAKGRSPEGGAPRGPRDGREKLSEKKFLTRPSAQGSIQSCAKREREAHGGPQAPPGTLRTGYCGWNFTKPDRASGESSPEAIIWTLIQFFN